MNRGHDVEAATAGWDVPFDLDAAPDGRTVEFQDGSMMYSHADQQISTSSRRIWRWSPMR